ncbi:calcium-binding protein [Vibrio rhodolitus]|uniref:calcium-binding protein n=1 Tax=Vibrio rhodolitus TaxID=2231649 RepID=UPI000E0ADFA1|nr:LEPR-XLL domain-containing protein [Vibrio rhodolitus]
MVGLGIKNGFRTNKLFRSVHNKLNTNKRGTTIEHRPHPIDGGVRATVFESMEPRLLLSAETLSANDIQALHDSLREQLLEFDAFLTQLENVEAINNGSNQLPFIDPESEGFNGQLGSILEYSEIITETVTNKFLTDFALDITDDAESEELQYQKFLNETFGSKGITVTKVGNTWDVDFSFDTVLLSTDDLQLDLSGLGEGIKLVYADYADAQVDHTVNFGFTFNAGNAAFDSLNIDTSLSVSAELTGALIKLGLFDFDIGEGGLEGLEGGLPVANKELSYTLGVTVELPKSIVLDPALNAADLINNPDFTYDENSQIVDLKLSLHQDQLVNGLDIPADAAISVITATDHQLENATIEMQEQLSDLTLFDAHTLYAALESLVDRIDTIFDHDAFKVDIPFLSDLELSELFSLRESLQTNLLDAFISVQDSVGLTEANQQEGNPSAADYLGSEIKADDAGNLLHPISSDFSFVITLSDGTRESIKWYPTESNPEISTVAELVSALNIAIASKSSFYVQVGNNTDDRKLRLRVVEQDNQLRFIDDYAEIDSTKAINVSDPKNHLTVDSIDDVVLAFAKALGNDVANATPEQIKQLADSLNLRFEDNALKFDLSFSLPKVSIEHDFSDGLSLGDLTGISSDGTIKLETDAVFDMTLGLDLNPLGEGSGVTADSVLGDLKIWSEGIEASGDGAELTFMSPTGELVEVQVSSEDTIQTVIANINNAAGGAFEASYDSESQKIVITQLATSPDPVISDGPITSRPGMNGDEYQSVINLKEKDAKNASLQATQMADDWSPSKASQFVITIGGLDPIVITVAAEAGRDLDGFISDFNATLAGLKLELADLNLSQSDLNSSVNASNLNWGQIISVAKNSSENEFRIVFTPDTILDVTSEEDEHGNVLRVFKSSAAKAFGMGSMALSNVEFSVLLTGDSLVSQVLGLSGSVNANGQIVSGDLHGQNIGDRVFLEDTGLSAVITADIKDVDISANIGMLGVDGHLNGYISLGTGVFLADDDTRIDINQLLDAANEGTVESIASADYFGGKESDVLGQLTISDVVAQGDVAVPLGDFGASLTIDLPEWENGELSAPVVNYDIQGLDSIGSLSSMSYADMVEGLQTILATLDSLLGAGFYDAALPLIDVSLKDILDVTGDLAAKLDQAEDDPNMALDLVESEIEKLLGIPAEAFDIRYELDYQSQGPVILLDLDYKLLGLEENLALNVNLEDLIQSLPSELRGPLEGLTNLIGVGAGGQLDLTLSSSLTALMGIKLSSATTPANRDTLLSELNNGQGLPTDKTDAADLTFTLKNGEVLELDLDGLDLSTATLGDLVAAIHVEGKLEASLEDGQIVLTDHTAELTNNINGLNSLGETSAEVTPPASFSFDSLPVDFDPKAAIQFDIVIGEQTIQLSLEADTERDLAKWVKEMNRELSKGLISFSDSGGVEQRLFWSDLLEFSSDDQGSLSLTTDSTAWDKLGFANGEKIALVETPKEHVTLVVEGGSTSDILHALGLADLELVDGQSKSSQLTVGSEGDRFFLDTNETGLKVNAEITSTDLDFSTYLGALELEVRDGTVVVSGDSDKEVKSDDFTITADGNVSLDDANKDDNNIEFKFGIFDQNPNDLDDGDSLLFFSEFDSVNGDFVETSLSGGAQALLPIYVAGVKVGDLVVNVSDFASDDRQVHIEAPDFASMLEELNFLNNPEILISGLDTFFASLDKILTDSVFGFEIPVIGNALEGAGDFISNLRNAIVPALWQELEEFKLNYPGVPPTTSTLIASVLEEQLNALGWQGVKVTGNENLDSKSVDFTMAFEYELFNTDIALDADFGFPGLGLSVEDGTIGVSAVAKMELGFGFSIEDGFYLDDGVVDGIDRNELELIIAADFSDMPELSASLGILQASVSNNKDDGGNSTSLTGTIGIDLKDGNDDGIMTFDELKGQKYMVEAIAKFETLLNLDIDAGFNDVLPVSLPAISANLYFDHSYEKVLYGEPREVMNVEAFELRDITLDVGEFLEGFLKPVLGFVDDALDPIRPVLDFITSPIPGVSDILGNTSLLDIGKMASGANPSFDSAIKFIDTVNQVSELIELLNEKTDLTINFGTYDFGKEADPFSGGMSEHEFDLANLSGGDFNANDPYSGMGDIGNALKGETSSSESSNSETKYGLSLPILTDPMMALRLLSGDLENIDLFLWHFPSFALSFEKTIGAKIPGVPKVGLNADVVINVDLGFDLAFGYDTSGFVKMIESGNSKYILDGFYIADYENGKEKPEAWFDASIALDANVNLFLFKAGVEGYLGASFEADLTDPNQDGKIRASEFIKLITETPEYLFEIEGKITAGIDVYFDIYFNYVFGKERIGGDSWAILPEQTIIDFSHNYEPELALGNVENGKLILNIGDYAGDRTVGDLIDGNEEVRIVQRDDGKILVFSDFYEDGQKGQVFDDVNQIVIKSGAGNDVLRFENVNSTIDIDIDTGTGDDKVYFNTTTAFAAAMLASTSSTNVTIRGGSGHDTIVVGSGNYTIYGGDGNDTITTGSGNNNVYGDDGDDIITTGSGNDYIDGGIGDDILETTGGNNTIIGDRGDDLIIAGSGNDEIHGGLGDDLILADGGEADNISIKSSNSSGGSDTIYGGDGDDKIIAGSGADKIYGESGNDSIIADLGEIGLGASNIIFAEATGTVGGNDKIEGGFGQDIILGGAGSDNIDGGDGLDVLIGDNGYVDGADAGTLGEFVSEATEFSSAVTNTQDTITGGAGRDLIFGGAGNDILDGGQGSDIILGDHGKVIRETAFSAAYKSVSSVHSNQDGDDTIDAAGGSNTVIGGSGADTITASPQSAQDAVGNNILVGDHADIQPAGTTIGDNPVADIVSTYIEKGDNDNITASSAIDVIIGGKGDDTLSAGDGNDLIIGDVGTVTRDETLYVLEASSIDTTIVGNDIITASAGDNLVIAGLGTDTVTTGDGQDVVLGDLGVITGATVDRSSVKFSSKESNLGGNDTISTGDGADVVIAGNGDDDIESGDGADIVLGDNGVVTGQAEFSYDEKIEADVVTSWEFVEVNSGSNADEQHGGNDTIDSGSDDDIVIAGAGDDTVTGGAGHDVLLGDLGIVVPANGQTSDVIAHNAANGGKDTIFGNDGNDVIAGGGDDDTINAGNDNDLVLGDNGIVSRTDEISGWNLVSIESTEESQGGNDTIDAGSGNDVVIAGSGGDSVTGGSGHDVLLGDLGIVIPANGQTPDVVARNAANGGKDTIFGNDGNDVIAGGGDDDTINAGNDNDLVLGDNGIVSRTDEISGWNLVSIESTEESQGGNDTIDAGSDNDVVIAGSGGDSVTGGSGHDVLLGDLGIVIPANGQTPDVVARNAANGGKDTIYGNDGNDVIAGGGDDDIINAGSGHDLVLGDNGMVTRTDETSGWNLVSIESTEESAGGNDNIDAGSGNDVAIAGAGDDTVTGGLGHDVLLGDLGIVVPANGSRADIVSRNAELGGDDVISGGDGHDVIIGSHGQDELDGDAGNDVILGDSGYVIRNSAQQALKIETTQVNIGDDDTILAGEGDDFVFGGQGDDTISGEQGRDIMFGDAGYQLNDANWVARSMVSTDFSVGGNDTIFGNQGEDFAIGGIGNDYLTGDEGRDTLIGDQGEFKWKSNGHRESAKTIAQANINGQFNDELHGGTGNDNLFGGRVNDELYGGLGSDILVGDEGNIFFKNDLEFIAQSKESFTGGADTMHLGTWANNAEGVDLSPDFLLGGEQPNFNFADALLDMILHENAHVELNPKRIGEWDEPPFLGDPVATTTDDFFSLAGEMDQLIDEIDKTQAKPMQLNEAKSSRGSINPDNNVLARSGENAAQTNNVVTLKESNPTVGQENDLLSEVVGEDVSTPVSSTASGAPASTPSVSAPSNQGQPSGAGSPEAGASGNQNGQPNSGAQPNSTPDAGNDDSTDLEDQVSNLLFFDAQLGLWIKAQPEGELRIQDNQPKVRII